MSDLGIFKARIFKIYFRISRQDLEFSKIQRFL